MTISEKIKTLRKSKKLTQEELAKAIGVERSSIGKYETGVRPSTEVMAILADFFGVTVDYLLGRDAQEVSTKLRRQKGVRIPVYGEVAAGIPILAEESYDLDDPDDWEEISEEMARGGDYFALRIHGDSMEPKISNGDVVIVRVQPDVDNGDVAIVRVNGDSATCKKIKKTPQGLMLISTNPTYEPMFYSPEEVMELPVVIIGKVVELRAKF